MTTTPTESTPSNDALRAQFEALLDEHRAALHDSLNGLSEEQARRSLVPSRTTLLGLVKHVTFVEGVYFDEAITGRSRKEIGIASTPDRSFILTKMTRSSPSRPLTGKPARRRAVPRPTCTSTTWSADAARNPCGAST